MTKAASAGQTAGVKSFCEKMSRGEDEEVLHPLPRAQRGDDGAERFERELEDADAGAPPSGTARTASATAAITSVDLGIRHLREAGQAEHLARRLRRVREVALGAGPGEERLARATMVG